MQSRAIRGIRVQSRGTHLPSHLTRSKLHGLSRRLEHARLLVRRLRLGLPDRLCHCRLLLRLGTHCRLPQQLLDLNLRRSRWQPEAISGHHRRHQWQSQASSARPTSICTRAAPVAPPPPSRTPRAPSSGASQRAPRRHVPPDAWLPNMVTFNQWQMGSRHSAVIIRHQSSSAAIICNPFIAPGRP